MTSRCWARFTLCPTLVVLKTVFALKLILALTFFGFFELAFEFPNAFTLRIPLRVILTVSPTSWLASLLCLVLA